MNLWFAPKNFKWRAQPLLDRNHIWNILAHGWARSSGKWLVNRIHPMAIINHYFHCKDIMHINEKIVDNLLDHMNILQMRWMWSIVVHPKKVGVKGHNFNIPLCGLRATSHTSPRLRPCKCEGPWLSSKGCTICLQPLTLTWYAM